MQLALLFAAAVLAFTATPMQAHEVVGRSVVGRSVCMLSRKLTRAFLSSVLSLAILFSFLFFFIQIQCTGNVH